MSETGAVRLQSRLMTTETPTDDTHSLIRKLEGRFRECGLVRPFRRAAYDPGDSLEYEVTGVYPAVKARVTANVERFVGGGFAGQVYRVNVTSIEVLEESVPGATGNAEAPITRAAVAGLEVGGSYAIKILTPPSSFARLFRNFLYFVGYQASFGAQVLPSADTLTENAVSPAGFSASSTVS